MVIKFKKRSTHELIYCFVFALYIFGVLLNNSLFSVSLLYRGIRLFCLTVLCMDWVVCHFRKISLVRFFITICIGLSCIIAALNTDRSDLIFTALFIICADNIDFDSIVKTTIIAGGSTIFFIVLSSLMGIIPNYTYYGSGGREALCLGFSYYSNVPYVITYLFIMYMYLRDYKIKWIEIIILFVCNYFLYKVTTVRLTYGLLLIAFTLEILLIKFKMFDLNKKAVKLFSTVAFPVAFFVVIVLTLLYIRGKPEWIYDLNELLSGRLVMNQRALIMYPITLFGQYIEMQGNSLTQTTRKANSLYIDSGFFYSLMGYGIVFTVVFLLIYSYLYRHSVIRNDKPLFIWITCVLIFTLINNTWVTITTNPVLLAFSYLIQSSRIQSAVQDMHPQRGTKKMKYT